MSDFKYFLKSRLILSTGIYTGFSFLNASIPFLLLPVLTTYLSKADYGIASMYQTLASFLLPFITLNASAALYRIYFKDKTIVPVYLANSIIVSGTLFFLFNILCFLLRKDLSSLFEIPVEWIVTIPVFCAFQFIPSIILVLFQAQIKPWYYGIFQVSQTIINAGLSLYLIIALSMNWEGRILAIVLSYLGGTIGGIFYLLKNHQINFKFDFSYITHLFKFGGGLIFHVIGAYLITLTSRLLLTKMEGLEATGLYSTGYQVASIIGFLTISFNNAFVPWLFSNLNLDRRDIKNKIVKFTYLYYLALILLCIIFYFSLNILYYFLINPKFHDSIIYAKWILVGTFFQGMYYMVTNYIAYSEKTYLQTLITFSIGLLNIPITYFFIQLYGGIGAAIAYACTFLLFFLFTWRVSQHSYKMPWFSFLKTCS